MFGAILCHALILQIKTNCLLCANDQLHKVLKYISKHITSEADSIPVIVTTNLKLTCMLFTSHTQHSRNSCVNKPFQSLKHQIELVYYLTQNRTDKQNPELFNHLKSGLSLKWFLYKTVHM